MHIYFHDLVDTNYMIAIFEDVLKTLKEDGKARVTSTNISFYGTTIEEKEIKE